jgi:hypothetical protein
MSLRPLPTAPERKDDPSPKTLAIVIPIGVLAFLAWCGFLFWRATHE